MLLQLQFDKFVCWKMYFHYERTSSDIQIDAYDSIIRLMIRPRIMVRIIPHAIKLDLISFFKYPSRDCLLLHD